MSGYEIIHQFSDADPNSPEQQKGIEMARGWIEAHLSDTSSNDEMRVFLGHALEALQTEPDGDRALQIVASALNFSAILVKNLLSALTGHLGERQGLSVDDPAALEKLHQVRLELWDRFKSGRLQKPGEDRGDQ